MTWEFEMLMSYLRGDVLYSVYLYSSLSLVECQVIYKDT